MLDDVRTFFDDLRNQPAWPMNLSALDPAVEEKFERHSFFARKCLDSLETSLFEIYEAGADDPLAIELLDQVVSAIRRHEKSRDERVADIRKLMERALANGDNWI